MNDSDEGFHSDWQVIVNEAILTAVFVSVILMVKAKTTTPTTDGVAGPLAIVLTLLACIQTGGKLGGCFNPTVGLALTSFSMFHLEDVNNSLVHYSYAFIMGPLLGGALAGAFSLVHRKHFEAKGSEQEHAEHNSQTEKATY